MKKSLGWWLLSVLFICGCLTAADMRRGLVALTKESGKVYLSWRLLTGEEKVAFNVFETVGETTRQLNSEPLTVTTDFIVATPQRNATYTVKRADGVEPSGSAVARPAGTEGLTCKVFKLGNPEEKPQRVGVGDLNGDGEYDFVVLSGNYGRNEDPWDKAWKRSKSPFVLEAFLGNGEKIWEKSLTFNIESGVWYSPYIVCDLDGDGKAEVICKTAPENAGDWRDSDGRVQRGDELLTVLDGMTGKVLASAPWPSREEFLKAKGGDPYNLYSRNQLQVFYDRGEARVMALRGTYGRMLVDAWKWSDGKLTKVWSYDNIKLGKDYWRQGAHCTLAADVNGDGRDEILLGSVMLSADGKPMWTLRRGHPDRILIAPIIGTRPGFQVVAEYETRCVDGGFLCADAISGEIIWKLNEVTGHVHHGYFGDMDARYRGWMIGGSDGPHRGPRKNFFFNGEGKLLARGVGENVPHLWSPRFGYWDADLQREKLVPDVVDHRGAAVGGGFRGMLLFQADLFGDWREELLTSYQGELRIYSTLIPAMDRRPTLMSDPFYRSTVCGGSSGYVATAALSYLPINRDVNLSLIRTSARTIELTVSAPLNSGVKGVVELESSSDVKLSATRHAIDLPPAGVETWEISLDGNLKCGSIGARLLGADGKQLLRNAMPLNPPSSMRGADLDELERATLVVEAETEFLESGGRAMVRDDLIGVYLKGVSRWTELGHKLTWDFNAPSDGRYRVGVRYASPGISPRRKLILNDVTIGEFTVPATQFGDGCHSRDWKCHTLDDRFVVNLTAGKHRLEMTNTDGKEMVLDCIYFIPEKK